MWPFCDETTSLEFGKVLELREPCFHPVTAVILNAIAALERFCPNAIETAIATETAF